MDRSSPTASTSSTNSISTGSDTRPKSASDPAQNPLISDTEKCRICGEAAAKHVHYGAVTCFSCRAFFRRSIQNGCPKNYACRKGGNCTITLKTRKNCQKCRFEKCLSAGMKTSWVLTDDERFRRFRKHREKITAKRRFSDEQIHPALAYGAEQGPESPRLHIAEELEGEEEEQDQPIDFSNHDSPAELPPLQPLFGKPLAFQGPPEQVVSTPEIHADLIHQNARFSEISRNEMETVSHIVQWHDRWYKSVGFAENLIKDMLFSSVSGTPLSINAAMMANSLMIQRVHRVATAFSPFSSLSLTSQSLLLKHNSELVVSLRGAIFFEQNKQVFFKDYLQACF